MCPAILYHKYQNSQIKRHILTGNLASFILYIWISEFAYKRPWITRPTCPSNSQTLRRENRKKLPYTPAYKSRNFGQNLANISSIRLIVRVSEIWFLETWFYPLIVGFNAFQTSQKERKICHFGNFQLIFPIPSYFQFLRPNT